MRSTDQTEKQPLKADDNEDLKKQIKEIQQSIERNEKLNKQKDDEMKQLDNEMTNLKDKIIDLSNDLDSLSSKQQELNNKMSKKDKIISENKTKCLSARCPQMHILQAVDASNIDKCSQCGKQFTALEEMKRCRSCDYNKCNKCYNLRAGSRRNTLSLNASTRQIIIKKVSVSTDQKVIKEIATKTPTITIQQKREWMQLKKVPTSDFSEAVQININNFIVATKAGIYKYTRKGWKLYIKYPTGYKGPVDSTTYSNGKMFDKCTLTVDRNKQILYMFTKAMKRGRMAEVDLKSKKWQITKGLKSAGDNPVSLFIDCRVHVFGGKDFHLMWNPNVKSLKCVQASGNISKGKNSFGVGYIEKDNSVLLFGGRNGTSNTSSVWQFKINEHRWIESGNINQKIASFAWVVTNDHKYVVIFQTGSSDILILNVDTMETTISPIKMPSGFKSNSCGYRTNQKSRIQLTAMLMDNSGKYELLLRGYIRKCFGKNIGIDVNKLILLFCLRNDVHLFNKNNGEHWKIDVETVLGFFEADNKGYNV